MKDFDPHQELHVKPGASASEIKKAYRRRSRETHPDVGGTNEAFQRVQRAHLLLTNDEAYERYQRTGDEKPPRDNASRAPLELAGMWVDALEHLGESAREEDVKALIKKNIAMAIGELLSAAEQAREKAQMYRDFAARVTTREDVLNLAADVLIDKAKACERNAADRDGKRELAEAMLELLKSYDWRRDEPTEDEMTKTMRLLMGTTITSRYATNTKPTKGKP